MNANAKLINKNIKIVRVDRSEHEETGGVEKLRGCCKHEVDTNAQMNVLWLMSF